MSATVPRALVSSNPLQWFRVFGPGAVIASLTIGTGELIFSSRGGAIFGYPILFVFTIVCLLKWTLAYSAARHMVISGVHPFQRWMDLPVGPRGWLPILFFLLAAGAIPVWLSFHASVLGDLVAYLTGTKHLLAGAIIHLWGCGMLVAVFVLAMAGGYSALERIQLVIVVGMLAAMVISLILFRPDWWELLLGFVIPEQFAYPAWMLDDPPVNVQKIVQQPVWAELSLYAGVVGGAGYDYLAYTSYLRDKGWGNAASHGGDQSLDDIALRQWIRAPLIDCTLSFLVVLSFTAVFVASGKLVLGPAHQIPGDGAFLEHQAQFVTHLHPWLFPLYAIGAFLTMWGTLYGTLEVAPVIFRETALACGKSGQTLMNPHSRQLRKLAVLWCTAVALVVLAVSFVYQLRAGADKPPGLTEVLKPVNLFTGVFACGLICLLNPWMDTRLPVQHRMPRVLVALNLIGGSAFILLGLRGYWDYAGWWAIGVLLGTMALGVAIAAVRNYFHSARRSGARP
jgi:Mn2+/Fe2+ NRAMP family transporter